MRSFPDGQRYSNEHVAKKLLALKIKFEKKIRDNPKDEWKYRREWIVAQIIWLREAEIIRNDIYRDFGLL